MRFIVRQFHELFVGLVKDDEFTTLVSTKAHEFVVGLVEDKRITNKGHEFVVGLVEDKKVTAVVDRFVNSVNSVAIGLGILSTVQAMMLVSSLVRGKRERSLICTLVNLQQRNVPQKPRSPLE